MFYLPCIDARVYHYNPVPAESKNKMAYLINRETGDKVDSMLITGNELKFSGTVADPYYARILIGDKRGPSFIVEPGEITIAQDGKCTSTALNKEMNAFTERYIAVARSLDSLPSDSLKQAPSTGSTPQPTAL